MADGISRATDLTKRVFQGQNGSGESEKYTLNDQDVTGTDIADDIFKTFGRVSEDLTYSEIVDSGKRYDSLWTNEGDKKATIDTCEWDEIFDNLKDKTGIEISDADREILFNIMDANGDGTLSAEEYSELMHKENGINAFSLWKMFAEDQDSFAKEIEKGKGEIYKGGVSVSDFPEDVLKNLPSNIADKIRMADGEMINVADMEKTPLGADSENLKAILEKICDPTSGLELADFENLLHKDDYAWLKEQYEENYAKIVDKKEGGNIGLGSGATSKIAEMEIVTDENAEGYNSKYIGIKDEQGNPATDNQLKMAKYLCEELGLNVPDEKFADFVLSLPPNEEGDAKVNNTFLLELASKYSKGTQISQKDMDTYLEGIGDDVVEQENGKTISGDSLQQLQTEFLEFYGDADAETANFALGQYLNTEFNLGLTEEQFALIVPEGKTAIEFLQELTEDGSLTDAEVKARLEEMKSNSAEE